MQKMDRTRFLKQFFTDRQIGAVTPTSSYGVKRLCAPIDFSKKITIVEYGPGTGVFSKYLLERITPSSKLILIEKNPRFADQLRHNLKDPRVCIHNDTAANVKHILTQHRLSEVDYAISCVPFSLLAPEECAQIVKSTKGILKPDGIFLAFAYVTWERFSPIRRLLNTHFDTVQTEREFWNIPPMFIFASSNLQLLES